MRSAKSHLLQAAVFLLIAAILVALAVRPASTQAPPPQTSMHDYSEMVYSPILSETNDNVSGTMLDMQENGLDYVNYWVQTSVAITALRENGAVDGIREVLESLMGTFQRNGCFPRPVYRDFEYGWVSSMDAPAIAVLAQLMYEETGEDRYRDFVASLSEYMTKDVSEHGYIAQIHGQPWLFEYADTNTTAETGEFVLNGSLLGTLCTAMVARVTGNSELWALVEKQTALYEEMMPQYWYAEDAWCYYMLQPKTVDPPHYVIFEIRLFNALAEATGIDFYGQEAQRRIDLLKSNYRLNVFEQDDGTLQYLFFRGGAPHYYYTDIYDTELVFLDAQDNILQCDRMGDRTIETAWMSGAYPADTARVEWNVVPNVAWSVEMGALEINFLEPSQAEIPSPLAVTYDASADGCMEAEDRFVIQAERSEESRCNLIGTLSAAQPLAATTIYAMELDNLSEETFSANIVLYDMAGNAISRYLPEILPGKNLELFTLPGFVDYGNGEMQDLSSFILRLYTSDDTKESEITIGNFYQLKNTWQLQQLLTEGEYSINYGNG